MILQAPFHEKKLALAVRVAILMWRYEDSKL